MHRRRRLVALAAVPLLCAALTGCGALDGLIGGALGGGTSSAHDGARTEDDDDWGSVSVYELDSAGTPHPAPTGLAGEVWQTFERVVTPEFAADSILEYRVGDAPDADTLAYVYQADDPKLWVLAANLATSEDEDDLVATLVHEYAHILTLSTDETEPIDGTCTTVETSEGCAHDDAALWEFEQQFWAAYSDAPATDNEDASIAEQFYEAHEEEFVSDYAATNVVEDIAESFMAYVLEDPPTGDSVAAVKLRFFAERPEFAAIRDRIRAEFPELGLS